MGKENFVPLPRSFYEDHAVSVAKKLLGKILVRVCEKGIMAGKIVEVEAYRGSDDPASHAYRGMSKRNKIMWGSPGVAYIYMIYGIHYCLNVVVEPKGVPAAVLIRALEPIKGVEIMKQNRRVNNIVDLTNGPAKLTQALQINLDFYGWDLTRGSILFIAHGEEIPESRISSSSRIGIKEGKDKPWRFFIKGNPFVSKVY
ncbi:MAG: DNA-3-methyladenine glycosylase [Thermoproteales archaeon]|nr:DNA-3-methyladenine glycosylase [Thermoproteales archaeon]